MKAAIFVGERALLSHVRASAMVIGDLMAGRGIFKKQ